MFNEGGNILLKKINKNIELIEKIQNSEEQISSGKFVKLNSSMSDEDIDDLLISHNKKVL